MRDTLPLTAMTGAGRQPARHVVRRHGWTVAAFLIAAAVALPVLVVLSRLLVPSGDIWAHLASTVLAGYVSNTVLLGAGVALGTLVVGTGTAWLVTMCTFPGRSVLAWLLLLPLAAPAYIVAYAYTDLLQYAGPVQSALRDAFGWARQDYWFPEIRSLGGAIVVMTLVLYPYVYLLARAAFLDQSACAFDVGRTLGRTAWGCFFQVAIPLARPALAGGVALAVMESLADFGTVQYFGVPTFTTGIYRTWFALGEPVAAAQLASALMLIVMLVLVLERLSRGRARYEHTSAIRDWHPFHLSGARALACSLACALPVVLGFLLPVGILLEMTVRSGDAGLGERFIDLAASSFALAALAAALTVTLALVIGYGLRLQPTPPMRLAARIAGLGYAIPGAVIAIGVLLPFTSFDNAVDGWMRAAFGVSTGLLISGSLAILVFAYLVRFLAVALNTVEAGLTKINQSFDDAARVLGEGRTGALLRVHVPILKGSVLTAGIMVFVDVLKELPATLILRPFNFETLAVRVYRFASDERLAEASSAALAIVAVGLVPVVVLSLAIASSRRGVRAIDRSGGRPMLQG
jgi:iron(III) transport system permease protein